MPINMLEQIEQDALHQQIECNPGSIDVGTFRKTGVIVVPQALDPSSAQAIAEDWKALAWDKEGRRELDYNPVNSTTLPESLVAFTRSTVVVDLLTPLCGSPLGLYNRRIVAKDSSFEGEVFLHQDSGYHRGSLDKVSLFVALSPVTESSGGLEFWLGTHRFGFLGDAGAIDANILPPSWPRVTPTMEPGDAVIMDSRTWHSSGPNLSGKPRILADLHYQSGLDASSKEVIWSDHWDEVRSIVLTDSPSVFIRSRLTTIREMDARLKELENPHARQPATPST